MFHFKPGFFDSYNALISLVYVYICLINMFGEGYVKTFFKIHPDCVQLSNEVINFSGKFGGFDNNYDLYELEKNNV